MCSVITLRHQNSPLLAANYDFYFGHGLLTVNRRGAHKQSLADEGDRLEWQSLYGSVTLNQFGCELPIAGINERGLCVHILESDEGIYPDPKPGRPSLIELQWVQYILDTTSSIDEAVASLARVNLTRTFFGLHFALADRHSVVFIDPSADGFKETRGAASMVLTNSPFEAAFRYREGLPSRGDKDSLRRFCRLSDYAQAYDGRSDPVEYAFAGLDLVRRRPPRFLQIVRRWLGRPTGLTVWQTVFDPGRGRLHLSTYFDERRKWLHMADLDFDPQGQNLIWNLQAQAAGDLKPHLQPYRREANAALIERTYAFLGSVVGPDDRQQLADYPGSFVYSAPSRYDALGA